MVADCESDLESPIERASPNQKRDEESPLLPRDTPQVVPIAGITTIITVLLLGMSSGPGKEVDSNPPQVNLSPMPMPP